MINEENYIDFIIENKLTQSQFLLLHLVYKRRYDLIKKYKKAFPTGDGSIIGRQATELLLERGLLIKGKTKNDLPQVSKKFREFYTNDYDVTEDIFNEYPDFFTDIKGLKIPLKAYDRTMFEKIYLSKILHSNKEHKEVLKDIKYGKERDLLKMGIGKFLHSEYWKVIRKLREGNEEGDIYIEDENDYS